jgi:hypothetical protein
MPDDRSLPAGTADASGAGDSDASELAAYGHAVDVAAHVPTLSGAVAAMGLAAVVWMWRQMRRDRAAAMLGTPSR